MKNKATKPQIQKINILLRELGIYEDKEVLVAGYTGSRTTHISEMYTNEARALIQKLVTLSPKEKLKNNVIHLGYRCGLLYGETDVDKKINVAKLNIFLRQRGSVKKDLDKMNMEELTKTKRQFEAMLKSSEMTKATKATKNLLQELDIAVA
ncbi:MAG: hypothetical protein DI598_14040 [Pseudopedobacter saltans]|uniref:Uncharacterized protein n=1 Tax=Pseudopedobacter saltans TaxID=151895 RepID=A0A2W5EU07_9SPHI|nr:MAG: hypothetical protein DI598_14040 [Pseudopedobacter saltans]